MRSAAGPRSRRPGAGLGARRATAATHLRSRHPVLELPPLRLEAIEPDDFDCRDVRDKEGDGRDLRAEQAPYLVADREEELVGWHPARHQRRHLSQRRLLVGEPCERLARLGIRDRGPDEPRELLEALLGIRRQCAAAGDDHRAPEATFHFDRARY
jgi:hypothetical protein